MICVLIQPRCPAGLRADSKNSHSHNCSRPLQAVPRNGCDWFASKHASHTEPRPPLTTRTQLVRSLPSSREYSRIDSVRFRALVQQLPCTRPLLSYRNELPCLSGISGTRKHPAQEYRRRPADCSPPSPCTACSQRRAPHDGIKMVRHGSATGVAARVYAPTRVKAAKFKLLAPMRSFVGVR